MNRKDEINKFKQLEKKELLNVNGGKPAEYRDTISNIINIIITNSQKSK